MLLKPRIVLAGFTLSLLSNAALANSCCVEEDEYEYGYEYDYDDRSYDYLLEGDFQLSLLLGVASISQNDSTIEIAPTIKDTLIQDSSDWDSWTGQFGVGYEMPLYWSFNEEDDDYYDSDDMEISWFSTLTPQINFYILNGGSLDGDVLLYGDANKNDATYSIDFRSNRLMFDLALDVLTVRDFSFYGLGGLGIAWNTTDFHWKANPGTGYQDFSLSETDTSGFAYEFGGGVNYAVDDDIDITLQYLYTVFNDVNVSGYNEVTEFESKSSDLDIKAQSVLLGVRLSI